MSGPYVALTRLLELHMSKCECAGWTVDVGWHAPECKAVIEQAFIDRVTGFAPGEDALARGAPTSPGSTSAAPKKAA